jgi:hypothetical protein
MYYATEDPHGTEAIRTENAARRRIVRRVMRESMAARSALAAIAVISVLLFGATGLAAAAPAPAHVQTTMPHGYKQWLLYWYWGGQNQKGPCALLFNANGTLEGDADGNCATIEGSWRFDGTTLNFGLKHSCDSLWTATYSSESDEFEDGTMEAMGPSCGGNEGTFWLSHAGKIDSITFNGTEAAPSVVTTGHRFGSEPAAEAVPSSCSATGDDFVGGEFYLEDVSGGWYAGRPGDCMGLFVSSYTSNQIDYSFGSRYDTAPHDFVLNPGDQLTVAVNGYSVLAYVDGFNGGTETNAPSLSEVESPTFV